jgi:beta-phosphoglucomutase-like phosphatase (HAD superfamily)
MTYAYIFDFDGVLANSMPAHFSAYRQALAEVHIPVDEVLFYTQAGRTGPETIRFFAEQAGVEVDIDGVYARTRDLLHTHVLPITAIPCNVALLKLLHGAGAPVAIATGSSRARVLSLLHDNAIEVEALVTAEDARRGKPFPDLFLVIEDSEVGIQAASAAGMQALRFYDKTAAKTL